MKNRVAILYFNVVPHAVRNQESLISFIFFVFGIISVLLFVILALDFLSAK